MLYFVILILFGASICLVTFSLMHLERRPPRPHLFPETPTLRLSTYSNLRFLRPLSFLTRPFENLRYLKELENQAQVLKIRLDVPTLILLKLFLAILLGVLAFVLLEPVYGLVALVVGFFASDFFLRYKIKAKKEAIARVIPETVDLLDMCISSGADFLYSVRWVIEKCEMNPFVEQLAMVLSEIQVGKTRTQALKDMASRLKIPDISSFVRTIIQSERMGTSMEEAFRNLSEDTRSMRFQAGERYAIKASIKIIFPLIFFILPTILIIVAGPILIRFTQGGLMPQGAGF